jgi:hypothetical protein
MSTASNEGDRIPMSQQERDRLRVLHSVLDGERTQVEAARLLRLTPRQVRRLQQRLQRGGDAALVHGLRGQPSNRRMDARASAVVCFESTARTIPTSAPPSPRRSWPNADW